MSLYQKYRPQKFSDVVGEDHVRDTLLTAIIEGRIGHGYLFAGPRGTGKTSVARLLARATNCQGRKEREGESCGKCQFCLENSRGRSLDIIEIDAASNRGIDEIRELREKVKFTPTSGKYKVVIIDEVHMLTLPAFNALLKTLEEPPNHVIFILATTEAHKVPATILSRVQRFDFRRINKEDIIKNLKKIIKGEGIKADEESLEAIAVVAEGSHRDSISLLEQVASLTREIKLDDVRHVLGLAKSQEVIAMIQKAQVGETKAALKIAGELLSSGVEAGQIIKEATEFLRQLLLYKISENSVNFEITKEREEKLKELSSKSQPEKINHFLEIFIGAGRLVKETSIRALPLEMAIVEASLLEVSAEIKPKAAEADTQKESLVQPEEKVIIEKKAEIRPPAATNHAGAVALSPEDWQALLLEMKKENHSLSALLRDAYPDGIIGDQLTVMVKFKFHLDKISENHNCQLIENVLEKVLGKRYRLVCQIAEKRSKPTKVLAEKDLEKAAEEIFETE